MKRFFQYKKFVNDEKDAIHGYISQNNIRKIFVKKNQPSENDVNKTKCHKHHNTATNNEVCCTKSTKQNYPQYSFIKQEKHLCNENISTIKNKDNNKKTNNKINSPTKRKLSSLTSSTIPAKDSKFNVKKKNNKHKIYNFVKNFLKKQKLCFTQDLYSNATDHTYVEFSHCVKVIKNNLKRHNCLKSMKPQDVMQDIRIRIQQQPQTNGSPTSNRRPMQLFPKAHLDCDENTIRSPSSEEDNSPTEMNNCRRLVDKPPLVKRLTMGLLRTTEESRPLVHNTSPTLNSGSSQTICDGYVNEGICEPSEKIISSKFGDSCRQSLTAISSIEGNHHHFHSDNSEFSFKKKYLRETSSANSSPKIFAPSAPIRIDSLSLSEQNELKGAAWFQAGIPREISLEVLSRQNPGAFLVRQSSTKPGCFALSLRVPPPAPKVAHYLILRTPRGYKIKGFTKEFSSLRALITHHSVMPELLPVPLTLPKPTHQIHSRRNLDDFDTYGSLNDFRKMMSDLNV